MAEEIKVTNAGAGEHVHREQLAANADVEATIEPHRTAAVPVPDDPEAARAEIEMTRSRMSETIDEIEGKLLRKKEEIQERLDVMAPVRQRPLPAVGLALGAGVLFGLLTGGDDEEEDEYDAGYERQDERIRELHERADTWEDRARRLLRIAQEQEEEIDRLAARRAVKAEEWEDEDEREEEWEDEDELAAPTAMDDLRDRIVDGVTGFVSAAVRDLVSSRLPGSYR